MATTDQRTHMQSIMQWMINHHVSIGYQQQRPMTNMHYYEQQFISLVGQGLTTVMDCSEFVTLLCKWSGLRDPNGMGYNGYGNSATMFDHLNRYTNPKSAHIGAIVVFGDGGATHAALVMTPGDDPQLCSHGSSKGPISVSLSALTQSMGSPSVTFLDIGAL